MESKLDWALRYVALGLPIVSLYGIEGAKCMCNKPGCPSPGKHPIPLRGHNEASLDAARIEKWWSKWPTANLGVRTGGLVIVLDVDGEAGALSIEGKVIPPTWTARTGRGQHIWFKHPGGTVRNFAHRLPGLDLRGDGGYVVVPPSVHVSGVGYVWLASPWDCDLAEAPAWLLELIASPTAPTPSVSPVARQRNPTPDTPTPDWAALLQGVPEGQRHDVAVRAAGHYLGIGIDAEDVEEMLLAFAERCQPPHDTEDIKRIIRDLAAKDAAKRRDVPLKTKEEAGTPVLTKLSTVAPESITWLWPQRLARGKLAIVLGDPGLGKSYMTLDISARVSGARPWPDGGRAPHGHVILLSAEDGVADTIRPRIDALGGDPTASAFLEAVRQSDKEFPFSLERDLPALIAAMQEVRPRSSSSIL